MDRPTRSLESALASRYRLEAPLGAGGMGTVYAAYDLRHARRVAVKVLRPELATAIGADRFLREIQLVARLHHPHILPLYDSGDADGYLYFVMPQIEGESLRQRLERDRRLPVQEAVRILRDVADGLGAAHRAGVVHRDIKPDNIMLEGRHALLADFGLAKRMLATSSGALTSAGLAIGTPRYMAPEQAAGSTDADERTDLYALGVVAYEMLAGVPPVDGPTAEQIMARQVTATPVPLGDQVPELPAALAETVMRCLAKDPAERPPSADEVLGVLEGLATPSGGRTPTSARLQAIRTKSRGPWLVAAALGVVAVAAFALRPRPEAMAPSPTQRQLTFRGDVVEAAISPDGSSLAFVTQNDSGQVLWVRDERSGREESVLHRPSLSGVAWVSGRTAVTIVASDSLFEFDLSVKEPSAVLKGVQARRVTRDGATTLGFQSNVSGVFISRGGPKRCGMRLNDSLAWTISVNENPATGVLAMLRTNASYSHFEITTFDPSQYCRANDPDRRMDTVQAERWADGPGYLWAWWSADGQSLYALRQASAGTVNVERIRPGGARSAAPSIVAAGLELSLFAGRPDFFGTLMSAALTGARAAYVRGRPVVSLEYLSLAGDPVPVPTRLTPGTSVNIIPTFAPDGLRLAYLSSQGDRTELRVRDMQTGVERSVPLRDTVVNGAAWSPDGTQLAVVVRHDAARRIAVVGLDPVTFHLLDLSTDLSDTPPLWAPGSSILYQQPGNTNYGRLRLQDGQEDQLFSPEGGAAGGYPFFLTVAPGGRVAAFYYNTSVRGIYLIDLDSKRLQLLVKAPALFPIGWYADGARLLALDQSANDVLEVNLRGEIVNRWHVMFPVDPFQGFATDGKGGVVLPKSRAEGDVYAIENFDPTLAGGSP